MSSAICWRAPPETASNNTANVTSTNSDDGWTEFAAMSAQGSAAVGVGAGLGFSIGFSIKSYSFYIRNAN